MERRLYIPFSSPVYSLLQGMSIQNLVPDVVYQVIELTPQLLQGRSYPVISFYLIESGIEVH